ncbi:hypothetical protein MZD04_gp146 [Pseudomonas phage Psa21]|uniref:Uncharacterized protein n=1 Tax=Pseudomonas phage Psa21 TaxID=2530023 RepID=A0A481W5L3_9CAUD|nr:hypothetical protein MZD04_gp146 [Pseudomonas phage Psa21]QBJ02673.1 hypothetical protein PSA21_146 [Pseudomonas phage Psa21]
MNLAQQPRFYRIVVGIGTPDIKYYCGDGVWTSDAASLDIIAVPKIKAVELMTVHGQRLSYELQWVPITHVLVKLGKTWFTVNRNTQQHHRVTMRISFGNGFFIKDMGTIEHCIVFNLSPTYRQSVYFRGQEITRVESDHGEGPVEVTTIFVNEDCEAAAFFHLEKVPHAGDTPADDKSS